MCYFFSNLQNGIPFRREETCSLLTFFFEVPSPEEETTELIVFYLLLKSNKWEFKHRPISLHPVIFSRLSYSLKLLLHDSRSVPAGGEHFFGLGTQTRPETLSLGAVELLDLPSAISQNPHPKSLFPILHPTVFPRA